MKRSQQQKKTREQIFLEWTDTSYGSGISLTAGIAKKRKKGAKTAVSVHEEKSVSAGASHTKELLTKTVLYDKKLH
jgi:hypothetical protein